MTDQTASRLATQPTDPPTDQAAISSNGRQHCAVCGALKWPEFACGCCRGWVCPVCGQPVYHDEGVCYDAHGQKHLRCSQGVAHPRPRWMASPVAAQD